MVHGSEANRPATILPSGTPCAQNGHLKAILASTDFNSLIALPNQSSIPGDGTAACEGVDGKSSCGYLQSDSCAMPVICVKVVNTG